MSPINPAVPNSPFDDPRFNELATSVRAGLSNLFARQFNITSPAEIDSFLKNCSHDERLELTRAIKDVFLIDLEMDDLYATSTYCQLTATVVNHFKETRAEPAPKQPTSVPNAVIHPYTARPILPDLPMYLKSPPLAKLRHLNSRTTLGGYTLISYQEDGPFITYDAEGNFHRPVQIKMCQKPRRPSDVPGLNPTLAGIGVFPRVPNSQWSTHLVPQFLNLQLLREAEILRRQESKHFAQLEDVLDAEGRVAIVTTRYHSDSLRYCSDKPYIFRKISAEEIPQFISLLVKMGEFLHQSARTESLPCHGNLGANSIRISKRDGSFILSNPATYDTKDGKLSHLVTDPRFNPFLLYSTKADVVALGVIMYKALSGQFPYDVSRVAAPADIESSTPETLQSFRPWNSFALTEGLLNDETTMELISYFSAITPLSELNGTIDPELDRIVHRAILTPDYNWPEFLLEMKRFLKKL